MDRLEQELNSLFSTYRETIFDREASPSFMPNLWANIERRRSFRHQLSKFSEIGAAAALAVCVLTGLLVTPITPRDVPLPGTYVDILAAAHADETVEVTGGIRLDLFDR